MSGDNDGSLGEVMNQFYWFLFFSVCFFIFVLIFDSLMIDDFWIVVAVIVYGVVVNAGLLVSSGKYSKKKDGDGK